LKEKQERRKKEREQEELEQQERFREAEERRKQEEEERRQKQEEAKRKKDEEKAKRQSLLQTGDPNKPNFVVPDKKAAPDKFEKFGGIVKAKAEMGLTNEQQAEMKTKALAALLSTVDFNGMGATDLRNRIKQMHQRLCKLEAAKYDLEKRRERQDYDLKELNERQRQINRNKAMSKGLDPNTAGSRYPPKISVTSKFDRQTDRRSYSERKQIYDKKSFPHFPNVPPPSTPLEKKIKGDAHAGGEEEGGGGGDHEEAAPEEVEVEQEEEEE